MRKICTHLEKMDPACNLPGLLWNNTTLQPNTKICEQWNNVYISIYIHIYPVKGTRLRKASLSEKVLQTLHSNELIDFFYISKIARFLDENVSSPTLLRLTLVFIKSDHFFLGFYSSPVKRAPTWHFRPKLSDFQDMDYGGSGEPSQPKLSLQLFI